MRWIYGDAPELEFKLRVGEIFCREAGGVGNVGVY